MAPRDAWPLLDDDVYSADPLITAVRYLKSEAMAGLTLYLDRRIVDLPETHINLLESRFALTAIDVSRHWTGFDCTVLNVIASDVVELEGLAPAHAEGEIVAELTRFFPFLTEAKIVRSYYQPHYSEPLVTNEVGAWLFRPEAVTGIENLYFAGSACRSHIDMNSMEGAVTTGLLAANAIMERNGIPYRTEIRRPKETSKLLMHVLRILGLPVAAFAKGWLSLRDWMRGEDANVPPAKSKSGRLEDRKRRRAATLKAAAAARGANYSR